jgi:AcrR family transcriptional regulator
MAAGRPRAFDIEKALDRATELFWRHGYEGASLAMLTAAMGINVPSLYAAFGSKEGLFRKALERYFAGPHSYAATALDEATALSVTEKIFQGTVNLVTNPLYPGGSLLIQGAMATGPVATPIRWELSQCRANEEAALRQRFERAKREGDLPSSADLAVLARYVMTVNWGIGVQAAGGVSRAQLLKVAEIALKSWPVP